MRNYPKIRAQETWRFLKKMVVKMVVTNTARVSSSSKLIP